MYGTSLEHFLRILGLGHLNKQEREHMYNSLEKHSDKFHLEGDELPATNVTKHPILMVHDYPVYTK